MTRSSSSDANPSTASETNLETGSGFYIRPATRDDVPLVLSFIRGLAEYEKLSHQVVATETDLERHLFGDRPVAEVVFGCEDGVEVGFALFFHNFSTFLGLPGIYLEDLFVMPEHRGKGYGQSMLAYLARLTQQRGCARLDWVVLDWNEPAIRFYKKLGAEQMADWQTFRLTGPALEALGSNARG